MKRTLTPVLWIFVLGLLIPGCGKKGGPDTAGKDSSPGASDTSDINRERSHASIQDLAADKYIGCDSPVFCAGIAYFDCNEKGGGSGLYYDSGTVALISRCGSFCTHPDGAAQQGMCDSLCPPKTWAECRKR